MKRPIYKEQTEQSLRDREKEEQNREQKGKDGMSREKECKIQSGGIKQKQKK
jgi:hypothetical protein